MTDDLVPMLLSRHYIDDRELRNLAAERIKRLQAENERLRDCLSSIRRHVEPYAATSALAKAVVATCKLRDKAKRQIRDE